MTPGPAGRKCTPYLLAGPGGMPLVLPLSEGLGSTALETMRTPSAKFPELCIADHSAAREARGQEQVR